MGLDHRCQECFEGNFDRLLTRFPLPAAESEEFSAFFHSLMNDHLEMTSPEIQRELQHKLAGLNGVGDPYIEEKELSNEIALKLYDKWKPVVARSGDPFDMAMRLAIAGNIMDYGANQKFDVSATIEKVISSDFAIDESPELKQALQQARKVLYLGDNAGEIVFDRLFIETIEHPSLTYAVRGFPAINDATMEDAERTGMLRVANVLSNGYDAPSTILHKSSPEFRAVYSAADVIISKGQGNFEGLMTENDPRIFFLLMVKCDIIAGKIGVPRGSFAVFNANRSNK